MAGNSEKKKAGGKFREMTRMEREAWLRRKLTKLWKRGRSECCEVRDSGIHGRGVYATRPIAKEERIIEYIGELVDKKEGERRSWKQTERAKKDGGAGVYIFSLSKKWDIDGDVPWNTARLINHSCDPNCVAWIEGKRIYIYALRDIAEGEELTFDYGFDVDCYEDHPCLCGSKNCVGYIVSQEQWPELKKRLDEEERGKD
jgi:SET domain-containing protein